MDDSDQLHAKAHLYWRKDSRYPMTRRLGGPTPGLKICKREKSRASAANQRPVVSRSLNLLSEPTNPTPNIRLKGNKSGWHAACVHKLVSKLQHAPIAPRINKSSVKLGRDLRNVSGVTGEMAGRPYGQCWAAHTDTHFCNINSLI